MIRQDIKELKSGPQELRKFGFLVGGVFCLLGLVLWSRGRAHLPFLIPGGLLVVLGAACPRALKPVYLPWMILAIALGFLVSHALLTVFFFLVITPIGLVARATGKDFLRLKIDRAAPSYWIARAPTKKSQADYERQF
ncbi:MAG TPA: SxtJ family membrane protein [Methylomirabilota bacterium]|jgi:integral membrane sensor domain MASE1|nr:SxtJ family membrane protein [Methylomirabilota bacterium]